MNSYLAYFDLTVVSSQSSRCKHLKHTLTSTLQRRNQASATRCSFSRSRWTISIALRRSVGCSRLMTSRRFSIRWQNFLRQYNWRLLCPCLTNTNDRRLHYRLVALENFWSRQAFGSTIKQSINYVIIFK